MKRKVKLFKAAGALFLLIFALMVTMNLLQIRQDKRKQAHKA